MQTDEELLNMYKTKKTNTLNKDAEIAKNQAFADEQSQLLDKYLGTQQNAIKQAQNTAEQNASIANTKMNKFISQNQQASGIASGLKGTDYINQNNSYLQNRATIANDAMTKQNDLLDSYAQKKLDLNQNAYDNEISILDRYRQYDIEDQKLEMDKKASDREQKLFDVQLEDYARQREWDAEDREIAKQDKLKAENKLEDEYYLQALQKTLLNIRSELLDDNNTLSSDDKQELKNKLAEYKDVFKDPRYYDKLLMWIEEDILGNMNNQTYENLNFS